jgi:NADPH2:quinone reductase
MPFAIRMHRTGGPEVMCWEELEVADPAPGEARVRHQAVGLNYIDIYHRSGLYPLQLPNGLGLEAAGVVEAVGAGVSELRPGDRVAYAGGSGRRLQPGALPARRPSAEAAGCDRFPHRGGDDVAGSDQRLSAAPHLSRPGR